MNKKIIIFLFTVGLSSRLYSAEEISNKNCNIQNVAHLMTQLSLIKSAQSNINFSHLKPREYANHTFDELIKEQQSLFAQLKEAQKPCSDKEYFKARKIAQREFQVASEITSGGFDYRG